MSHPKHSLPAGDMTYAIRPRRYFSSSAFCRAIPSSSFSAASGQNSQQSSIHSSMVPKKAGWRCRHLFLFLGLNGAADGVGNGVMGRSVTVSCRRTVHAQVRLVDQLLYPAGVPAWPIWSVGVQQLHFPSTIERITNKTHICKLDTS
jgi:hypothetical protein